MRVHVCVLMCRSTCLIAHTGNPSLIGFTYVISWHVKHVIHHGISSITSRIRDATKGVLYTSLTVICYLQACVASV